MPRPERDAPEGALPKLTLTQRLLTALPDLQRRQRPAAPAKGPAGRNGSGAPNGAHPADRQVVRPDAVSSPATATTGSRLRDAFLKPPAPSGGQRAGAAWSNPYAESGVDELRQKMKYLDDRERRIALFVGPLMAALDIAIMLVGLHGNPAHGKNHVSPSNYYTLGIGSAVLALVVVVAAYFRRRSFTIFALLFSGYGGGLVTMLPSWVTAGWLFVRFNKMQRALTLKTGGPPGRQGAGRQRTASGRADATARPRLGAKRAKTPEPAGPAPNKRYTPPKPGT
ncbi:MAG: hypothetical protein KGJ77_04790 [Acidobacteriota bacterium]|nr:hypothetical protein [Acidobacteriota bacterium]